MKMPRHIERLSTRIALLVLSVGFVSLGLLSFTSGHPEDAATALFSEATYAIVGSTISILVGVIFLAAVRLTGRIGGSGGENRLTENIMLNFYKVSLDYVPQDDKGGPRIAIPMTLDIAANVSK
jgi:hypothetical protein